MGKVKCIMKVKEAILKEMDKLPKDKLNEVLDFVTFLKESKQAGKVVALRGLWEGKVALDAERELKKLRKRLQRRLEEMNL